MESEYDPVQWALDDYAFEQWFYHGDDADVNPRIEMVQDIIDDLPEPHRTRLEETYYERLSRREIMRRHALGNPYYAQQEVVAAQAAFQAAWIERHGEIE
jgi:hypothetical protein